MHVKTLKFQPNWLTGGGASNWPCHSINQKKCRLVFTPKAIKIFGFGYKETVQFAIICSSTDHTSYMACLGVISVVKVEEWFHTINLEGNEAEFTIKGKFLDCSSLKHCAMWATNKHLKVVQKFANTVTEYSSCKTRIYLTKVYYIFSQNKKYGQKYVSHVAPSKFLPGFPSSWNFGQNHRIDFVRRPFVRSRLINLSFDPCGEVIPGLFQLNAGKTAQTAPILAWLGFLTALARSFHVSADSALKRVAWGQPCLPCGASFCCTLNWPTVLHCYWKWVVLYHGTNFQRQDVAASPWSLRQHPRKSVLRRNERRCPLFDCHRLDPCHREDGGQLQAHTSIRVRSGINS